MKVLSAAFGVLLVAGLATPLHAAPADTLVVPRPPAPARTDSTVTPPSRVSIVRVPVGHDPGEPPDTTEAADQPERPRLRADGTPVPESRLFLVAGLAFPLGPPTLTNQWNPGGTFGAGADVLLEPRFGVRLRGDWAQLPYDSRRFLQRENLYGTGAAVEGGAASLVLASAQLHFHTRGTWPCWYVEGGPGAGMFRHGDALIFDPFTGTITVDPGETSFHAGASAGAGVQLTRPDGSGLFLDLHWNALFTPGHATQFVPFTFGVLFP